MRVKTFIAASIIVALAGSAWAQQKPMQRYGEKDKDKTWSEREQEKEAERAYKRLLAPLDRSQQEQLIHLLQLVTGELEEDARAAFVPPGRA